jgi:uncharacterized protein (DUF427 family)
MNNPPPAPPLAVESVWDYPRPPRLESTSARVRILHQGQTIADTIRALRILETSHPPVYYIPPADCTLSLLRRSPSHSSYCEFKGFATYWDLVLPDIEISQAGWSYESPTPPYAALAGHLALYASKLDECWVNEERIVPQPGDFYGGWITSNLRGPFKGAPGTRHW